MTGPVLLGFAAVVLCTSFVAGVFGMAGGMLLMGALLFLVSVPDAMVLHGVTQMSSNGSRAVLWRRYVVWSIVARYALGLAAAAALMAGLSYVPDRNVIFLVLGLVPFLGRIVPAAYVPQAGQRGGAELCGFICTSLQLLSGVSGPMLDVFFVRSDLDRRVVVATKAACQIVTHLTKLVYFGALVGGASGVVTDPLTLALAVAMAVAGTTLSRGLLERLTDHDFRRYTWWLVMAIGTVYLVRGIGGLTGA